MRIRSPNTTLTSGSGRTIDLNRVFCFSVQFDIRYRKQAAQYCLHSAPERIINKKWEPSLSFPKPTPISICSPSHSATITEKTEEPTHLQSTSVGNRWEKAPQPLVHNAPAETITEEGELPLLYSPPASRSILCSL